jgi:hypothetical protein
VRRFVALVQYDNRQALALLKGFSDIERRGTGSVTELTSSFPGRVGSGRS